MEFGHLSTPTGLRDTGLRGVWPFYQPQRGCVLQPRVAVLGNPGYLVRAQSPTPTGLRPSGISFFLDLEQTNRGNGQGCFLEDMTPEKRPFILFFTRSLWRRATVIRTSKAATPLGLGEIKTGVPPKVGEYANHWALSRNPFGVEKMETGNGES